MDATTLAVLSIFGGAALTALAALVGATIQARREHRRWIREQRLIAYQRVHALVEQMRYGDYDRQLVKDFERELTELADKATISKADRERFIAAGLDSVGGERQTPRAQFEWSREIVANKIETNAVLALVGPREVRDRLEAVFASITDRDWSRHAAALAGLEQSMRSALGVKD